MKMHRAFPLAAVLAFACAPMRTAPLSAQPQTTLKVDNQGFLDMTIYVRGDLGRVRLGLASGAATTKFVIPDEVIRSATSLRFVADPIGSARASVSQEISVRPGDEVVMQIPPA